jgi:hypothetical protein
VGLVSYFSICCNCHNVHSDSGEAADSAGAEIAFVIGGGGPPPESAPLTVMAVGTAGATVTELAKEWRKLEPKRFPITLTPCHDQTTSE